jgi:hypothetical protein
LPVLVAPLLQLFAESGARATFFTVGDVARDHPELVRRVAAEGHEIACHGDRHIPLTQLGPPGFASDLARNIDSVRALGLDSPRGFRAPLLSLGPDQAWCHALMREAGIEYSSSVLPARTPLHGWPDFGTSARNCSGVLEIPVTVERLGPFRIPCFSGVYFRVLPAWLTNRLMRQAVLSGAVSGYLHPYDFDSRQRWTWHAQLHGRPLLNHFLFVRRSSMLGRLRRLLNQGWTTRTFGEHFDALRANPAN